MPTAEVTAKNINIKNIQSSVFMQNLKTIETDKEPNLYSILDQNIKKIAKKLNTNDFKRTMIKKSLKV